MTVFFGLCCFNLRAALLFIDYLFCIWLNDGLLILLSDVCLFSRSSGCGVSDINSFWHYYKFLETFLIFPQMRDRQEFPLFHQEKKNPTTKIILTKHL